MDRIFAGMLFVLFDLNVTLAGVPLRLLPDCVGYLLVLGGLMQLRDESPVLQGIRPLAALLAVYSFLSLIGTLTRLTANPFLSYIIDVFDTVGRFLLTLRLVRGLRQMEAGRQIELYSARLRKYWALMVSFQVFSLLLIMQLLLSAACNIISFLFGILFMLTLNMARINWKNGNHERRIL